MDEPAGSTVMADSSGRGIHGTIGSAVGTGTVINGATAYNWPHGDPNAPPAKPERLVVVDDSRLNPGDHDYAMTVRFRTTSSYGNMIQKGQSTTAGGYFKWEIPKGRLTCLFRSRDQAGNLLGEKSVKSPLNMPLNDGAWHTVRCEKTADRVTMTIDGSVTTQSARGVIGPISNTWPLSIAGKWNCNQDTVTCDYFAGDIDWIRIEVGSTGSKDSQAPTVPGVPVATVTGLTSADLAWAHSTDNVDSTVLYRIYRNGNLVGTTASSASTVVYTDTEVPAGSTNTYRISAVDMAGNVSGMSPESSSVTQPVAPLGVFIDDFSSGWAFWNQATGMTIDQGTGHPGAPSMRAQVTSTPATATKTLSAPMGSLCASTYINATSLVSNSILMRLLNASSAGIVRVFVNSSDHLVLRSDVGSTQVNSGVALGSGWHEVELCGSVGTSSSWSLYRDGVRIVNGWNADTGTHPVARLQLGDFNARTWAARFDMVVVDESPGTHFPGGGGATTSTITTSTTTTSTTTSTTTVPSTTTSTTTAPSTTTSTTTTVPSGAEFADDFSSGNFSAWSGVTRMTIDSSQGFPAAPSARAQVSGLSAWAYRTLDSTHDTACFSTAVNAIDLGGNSVDLFRLRTVANGPIIRVLVNTTGRLVVRSDVSGAQGNSGIVLGSGWHDIELCGTVGSSSSWDLYLDGVRIMAGWTADTGTTPIGRVQIGDTAAKTFTMNFDRVRLDQTPG